MSWFCSQIGAREHYAISRALHQMGRLGMLYTDFWAGSFTRKIMSTSESFGSLTSRFHPDLAGAPIHSLNLRSLAWEARLRRKLPQGEEVYLSFCQIGCQFASAVRKDLKRRRDLSPNTIFFAYDTGALETLEFLHERGIKCVVDQMDPNRVEVRMVYEEEQRWEGWSTCATKVPEKYFSRRALEWSLADRVVVNSEFSKQALIEQGVPEKKLKVMPLCYEAETPVLMDAKRKEGNGIQISSRQPLQVLFLGQVILRKGIQYLVEAAKLLSKEPVHFHVVGPIGISDNAIKSAPLNMTFHGRANRAQASQWYRQSDIFVLPTLSDGFAITQIEAMAHGLPVITTPNCGEVVTDGVDGFITPPRDTATLTRTLLRYVENRGLLQAQQEAAKRKAGQFTLLRLAENLAALQRELYNQPANNNGNQPSS